MTDYISREEALSFPFANGKYDHEHANGHFINGCITYHEWISQLHVADVVEVVRCKDCVYVEPTRGRNRDRLPYFCTVHREKFRDMTEYCSFGKRKGET